MNDEELFEDEDDTDDDLFVCWHEFTLDGVCKRCGYVIQPDDEEKETVPDVARRENEG